MEGSIKLEGKLEPLGKLGNEYKRKARKGGRRIIKKWFYWDYPGDGRGQAGYSFFLRKDMFYIAVLRSNFRSRRM